MIISIGTIQCRFDKVGKCVDDLSQHEALRHLDVRESALCVTFRASLGGTNFRLSTLRSEYVMISLALSTPVPLTTVSVTFGAPRWPVPGRTRQVPYAGGSAMHVTKPSPLDAMFKICYDFPHSGRACPSDHNGRNVSRASLAGSGEDRGGIFHRRERHACEEA